MTVDIKLYELEYSGDEGKYKFKLPKGNGLVSGIDRLAQQIAKSLLTTPGTDLRFPHWGGGADSIPPIMHDTEKVLSEYSNSILFAVSKVEQDIKNSQVVNPTPADESLLSIEVLDIELTDFDKVTLLLRILTVERIASDVAIKL